MQSPDVTPTCRILSNSNRPDCDGWHDGTRCKTAPSPLRFSEGVLKTPADCKSAMPSRAWADEEGTGHHQPQPRAVPFELKREVASGLHSRGYPPDDEKQ